MQISIPIYCGFIAYLFLPRGKQFPNNIYISHALVCGSFSFALIVNAVFRLGATPPMNRSLPFMSSHAPFNKVGNVNIL